LISEGHAAARHYPLVVLWQEAQIVRERLDQRSVTDTLLLDAVVAKHLSGDADHFNTLIEGLQNGR